MANTTDEKKLSDLLYKVLNRLDFNPHYVVMPFDQYNSQVQSQMFEMIMVFLNHYANKYRDGITRPGEPMHRIGSMCVTMLDALTPAEANGKHHPQGRTRLNPRRLP